LVFGYVIMYPCKKLADKATVNILNFNEIQKIQIRIRIIMTAPKIRELNNNEKLSVFNINAIIIIIIT